MVSNGFGAEVHLVTPSVANDLVQIDQDECSTVVPEIGHFGLVILGEYKESRAKVLRADGSSDWEVQLTDKTNREHCIILPATYICRHIVIDKEN